MIQQIRFDLTMQHLGGWVGWAPGGGHLRSRLGRGICCHGAKWQIVAGLQWASLTVEAQLSISKPATPCYEDVRMLMTDINAQCQPWTIVSANAAPGRLGILNTKHGARRACTPPSLPPGKVARLPRYAGMSSPPLTAR